MRLSVEKCIVLNVCCARNVLVYYRNVIREAFRLLTRKRSKTADVCKQRNVRLPVDSVTVHVCKQLPGPFC
jgi:hypothetical protein